MGINFSRRSDKNASLTKEQKQAQAYAKKLINKKQIRQAATILDRAQLFREAVSVFEEHGYVKEAAGILIRIGAVQRAGFLLARNKYYLDACVVFQRAGLFNEAATAAQSSKNFKLAAELFKKSKKPVAAAKCHLLSEKFLLAARCYVEAFDYLNASRSFVLFREKYQKSWQPSLMTDNDRQHIVECIIRGFGSISLIQMLRNSTAMSQLIIHIAQKNQQKILIALIRYATAKDIERVVSKINYSLNYAKTLAHLLYRNNHPKFAGYVFERLGESYLAAQAFEECGQYQRALSLFHLTGHEAECERLKKKMANLNQTNEEQHEQKADVIKKPPPNQTPHIKPEVNQITKTEHITPKSFSQCTLKSCVDLKAPKSFYFTYLFSELTKYECNDLWQFGMVRYVKKGEVLWQTSTNPMFGIVLKGSLIHKKKQEIFRHSDCFGEILIFSDIKVNMAIIAQLESEVFCLNRDEFTLFADKFGGHAYKLYKAYMNHMIGRNRPQALSS
ncbi:MAG: hypothetical protein OXC40_06390 [Proteobacteria bacterium]|nr:hypothetical protein [Pseudomonadota bacterium]